MNTATLLESLQNDMATLKTNVGAKGVEVTENDNFTTLAAKVASIPSGGATDIYKVASIAERDALTGVNEDDMCVVYASSIVNWQKDTQASSIIFPETVMLPSAYEGDYWGQLENADESSSSHFDGNIQLMQQEFRLEGYGDTFDLRVSYSSEDGITFTRQEFRAEDMETGESYIDGNTVNLPIIVKLRSEGSEYDETLGYFMQTGSMTFDGIFSYKDGSWEYADININITSSDLFSNKNAYTSNGIISGNLGSTLNIDIFSNNYIDITNAINNWKPAAFHKEYSSESIFHNYSGTSLPITRILDTSEATDLSYMFDGCTSLTNLDVSNFNTSKATTMYVMFAYCSALTNLDVSNFNTSNVTNMDSMFRGCNNLVALDLSNFDTSNVTTFSQMFGYCYKLTSLDLSSFNTSNLSVMREMFRECNSLVNLDLSNWTITQNMVTAYGAFQNCQKLTSLDLSNWNMTNVLKLNNMFVNCYSLTNLNLNGFVTSSKLDTTESMFAGCESLTNLDLSGLITTNVSNVRAMFYGCTSLMKLDIRNCEFTQITSLSSYNSMFGSGDSLVPVNCLIIVKDTANKNWITSKFTWLTNVQTVAEYEASQGA